MSQKYESGFFIYSTPAEREIDAAISIGLSGSGSSFSIPDSITYAIICSITIDRPASLPSCVFQPCRKSIVVWSRFRVTCFLDFASLRYLQALIWSPTQTRDVAPRDGPAIAHTQWWRQRRAPA